MGTYNNDNLNGYVNVGNTGYIPAFVEPGIPVALVLAPKGTIIPASAMASQSAFATYVNAKFTADARSGRWYALTKLDKFEDKTKDTSTEDTGIFNLSIYSFPKKFSFRYMQNMGNYIEMTRFNNWGGDIFIIDSNGNWWNTYDSTGAKAFSLTQLFVPSHKPQTTTTGNQYMVECTLTDVAQMEQNFKIYQANYNASNITMLQNLVFTDLTATLGTPLSITATTTAVLGIKFGQDSLDFIEQYASVLTNACIVAFNTTTSAAATISTSTFSTITVAGQVYWYVKCVLAVAPTASDVVRFMSAAPSVVNGVIANSNVVTEIPNAALHTF